MTYGHGWRYGLMAEKERTVAAGEFKNRCLQLIDEVHRHGVPLTVTKRGKPMVRVVPAPEAGGARSLEGSIVREDESIYSTGEFFDVDDVGE